MRYFAKAVPGNCNRPGITDILSDLRKEMRKEPLPFVYHYSEAVYRHSIRAMLEAEGSTSHD